MRLALDVEGVLADSETAAVRSTDKLSIDDVKNRWLSKEKDSLAYQIFIGASDAVWRHRPEAIPPEEPNLSEYVNDIYDNVDELDIVTHRQYVDKSVIWWLDEYSIPYDNFISTDRPKEELGYDVYIDDNPDMVGQCPLFLRHQTWNANVNANIDGCYRVYSLGEIPEHLS